MSIDICDCEQVRRNGIIILTKVCLRMLKNSVALHNSSTREYWQGYFLTGKINQYACWAQIVKSIM